MIVKIQLKLKQVITRKTNIQQRKQTIMNNSKRPREFNYVT